MAVRDPALTFSLALAAGMLAQVAAHHLRIPGIVLLLLAGVLLGPDVASIIHPETLGHGLDVLVGLAVAVVLFEGGLNLNLSRLRREALSIRRLITVGALITAAGGTLGARWLMGWEWQIAILFGTLVIVTGPTVITPLLRRIRIRRNVSTILEAEGVLIDPVGAITAVVALEIILDFETRVHAAGLLGLPGRLILGAVLGLVGGLLIGVLIRHDDWVPDGLENVFTLALVLGLFATSNAILPESGIMAAVVAGMVVGNMKTGLGPSLREFKETLTVLLVGLLFVLLAADVRLAEVAALGWAGVLTVLALMLVVRPLAVAASTAGSGLSVRERAFIAWLGPRGIVAAAVASLFAQALAEAEIPGGAELRAMVFLVIAVTVVVQGLSSGWVASMLGVRRPPAGYAIVGANALGRALARVLTEGGEPSVLIDSNAHNVRAAEEEGCRVIFGNANDEGRLARADVDGRLGFLSVTPNEGVNLLLARRVREHFSTPRAAVTLHRTKAGVQEEQVHEAGIRVLFGAPIDIGAWTQRLDDGDAAVERWRFAGTEETEVPGCRTEPGPLSGVLPLALTRADRIRPVDDSMRVRPDDVVTFAVGGAGADAARDALRAAHWEFVAAPTE